MELFGTKHKRNVKGTQVKTLQTNMTQTKQNKKDCADWFISSNCPHGNDAQDRFIIVSRVWLSLVVSHLIHPTVVSPNRLQYSSTPKMVYSSSLFSRIDLCSLHFTTNFLKKKVLRTQVQIMCFILSTQVWGLSVTTDGAEFIVTVRFFYLHPDLGFEPCGIEHIRSTFFLFLKPPIISLNICNSSVFFQLFPVSCLFPILSLSLKKRSEVEVLYVLELSTHTLALKIRSMKSSEVAQRS